MAKKEKGYGYWTRFGKSLFTWQGILILIGTGLAWGYFFSRFDLIPDSIPFIGYLDDVIAVALAAWGLSKFYYRFVKK